METLELEFPNREALLASYSVTSDRGGLSIDQEPPCPTGASLRVNLRVLDPARSFQLECRVSWTRFARDGRNKPGYGLEFLNRKSGVHARLLFRGNSYQPQSSFQVLD